MTVAASEEKIFPAEPDRCRATTDWVFIRADEIPDKVGSIHVPHGHGGTSLRNPLSAVFGKVLSVGPGAENERGTFIPTVVTPGMSVAFQLSVDNDSKYRDFPNEKGVVERFWFISHHKLLAWFEEEKE